MKKTLTIKKIYDIFQKYGNLDLKVETPYGYKDILWCDITEPNGQIGELITETGKNLECSLKHKIKKSNNEFEYFDKLKIDDNIQTIDGNEKIVELNITNKFEDLYDIEVKNVHQYYSNGILSHNSTATIDLMLFLFFNSSTKSKVNGDIFNRFRDKDNVSVKGFIEIDGIEYVITRMLIRTKSRDGDYTVKHKVSYQEVLKDGLYKNLNGDEKLKTQTIINNAIGTEADFLSTILTTAHNIEELIDSKPTARGLILNKFLGLESLKEKEIAARKKLNEWSKTLISNTHDKATLKSENKSYKENIKINEDKISELENNLVNLQTKFTIKSFEKDTLLSRKNNNVDPDIYRINPRLLNQEIRNINEEIGKVKIVLNSIEVKEPSSFYDENDHNELKDKINTFYLDIRYKNNQYTKNNENIQQLKEGEFCPTCKQALKDVDHSNEIKVLEISNEKVKIELLKLEKEYDDLVIKEKTFAKLQDEFNKYEKNKFRKEKHSLDIEQKRMEIKQREEKIEYFEENKKRYEENIRIDSELTGLKTQLETINAEINQNNILTERCKNNIISFKDKIKINNELIDKILKEEKGKIIFKHYLMIFGKNGISKVIMKNMIPLINLELHRLLIDSCPFILELNINEKNELNFVMIDMETRVIKPLNAGSGFERTISSLALRSVLTKISTLPKPNFVIMDEALGKVADENLDLVGEFFKKIKTYFEHIFVISHNSLVRNWSDNLMMISKNDNISKVDFLKTKF